MILRFELFTDCRCLFWGQSFQVVALAIFKFELWLGFSDAFIMLE